MILTDTIPGLQQPSETEEGQPVGGVSQPALPDQGGQVGVEGLGLQELCLSASDYSGLEALSWQRLEGKSSSGQLEHQGPEGEYIALLGLDRISFLSVQNLDSYLRSEVLEVGKVGSVVKE